jgi:hypothetical protein
MAKKMDADTHRARLRRRVRPAEAAEQAIESFERLRSLDPIRRVELQLAASKGYAPTRRRDFTADGRLIQSCECTDFQHSASKDIWMPRVCTLRTTIPASALGDRTQSPESVTTLTLVEISFDRPKDVSFQIRYEEEPGALVFDRSVEEVRNEPTGAVTKEVSARGEVLRDAASASPAKAESPWSTRLIIANVILLCTVGGYFVWRQMRLGRRS